MSCPGPDGYYFFTVHFCVPTIQGYLLIESSIFSFGKPTEINDSWPSSGPPTGRGSKGYFPGAPKLFPEKGPHEAYKKLFFTFLGCIFILFRFLAPDIYCHYIVWTQSVNAWVEQSVLTRVNTWYISLINS